MLHPGARSVHAHLVDAADTAVSLGSGDLEVLGTPRLLTWCEAQTVAAVADELPDGSTSVGTKVSLEHLAATPVGARVQVAARLVHVAGRRLRFEVDVTDQQGSAVARGEVTRVVVDRDRFGTGLD